MKLWFRVVAKVDGFGGDLDLRRLLLAALASEWACSNFCSLKRLIEVPTSATDARLVHLGTIFLQLLSLTSNDATLQRAGLICCYHS